MPGYTITVYSTTSCGHCKTAQRALEAAGLVYELIHLDQRGMEEHRARYTNLDAETRRARTVPLIKISCQIGEFVTDGSGLARALERGIVQSMIKEGAWS